MALWHRDKARGLRAARHIHPDVQEAAVDAGDVFWILCDLFGNSPAKFGRLAQVIMIRSPFGDGKALAGKGMLRDEVACRRYGETLPLQNGAQLGQARSHPDVPTDGDRQRPTTGSIGLAQGR
jgi:hypothetical protein